MPHSLTVLGISAAAIANPANHRLSAKGGGLNRAVHAAAPALETATRAASGGGVAAAGCVLVPSPSPQPQPLTLIPTPTPTLTLSLTLTPEA